jgi:hypothetical protein
MQATTIRILLGLSALVMTSCESGGECGTPDDGADGAGASGQACEERAEFIQIAACMVRVGDPPAEAGYPVEYTADGTVLEAGIGMPPDNCFHHCNHVGGCLDEKMLSWGGKWVRVEAADAELWTVAFVAPFETPWPVAGDVVSLEYRFGPEAFMPDEGVLEVRSDGELVVWVGIGGSPELLEAPEGFDLEKGEAVCQEGDECGTWSMYLLDVSVDGQSGTAGYRTDPLHIADHRVLNAGILSDTSSEATCLDWFAADARVLIWPDL